MSGAPGRQESGQEWWAEEETPVISCGVHGDGEASQTQRKTRDCVSER